MDQKRLMLAIAVSIAILLGFQFLVSPHLPHPPPPPPAHVASNQATTANSASTPAEGSPGAGGQTVQPSVPKNVPRLQIAAPRLRGSISLVGARIDDLILTDYRETLAPDSPNVRLLEPLSDKQPYYVQYGWTPPTGAQVKVPGSDTLWTASADTLSAGHPVTLSWDNGEGLTFELQLSIDDDYMFSVQQGVKNATGQPVKLFPWARISRDYTPEIAGYYILFEGLLGVTDGTLHETTYAKAKSEGEKANGVAYDATATGGWGGITDKYWLTSLVPDQSVREKLEFRHISEGDGGYQVDFIAQDPATIAAGATAAQTSHLFAGAKIVRLLDRYESDYHIPNFDKAVDFGWFYLITKPIFYCLDWLNGILGNFGLAIIAFTTCVKLLFFPLANYSYRSMSKMKLLGPKMTALRERLKDDPSKMQAEMMAMYRAEKVNPASGCLPMVVQIPVFFSLYKDIFVTIEMRHAPFFGWIHDLSAVDPTNVFNLFGLIPFDPTVIAPFLHLGAWPLIMGCTMFFQQRLNPPPPDPMQAKIFQFMPIVFTFMLANFPAGLVIYWSWNNTLSIAQQWLIMKRTRLARPGLAR
ncbi:MAG TPA: membrane protein insertase YidC, partial [Acetobacteraceae bacterium]